MHAKKSIVNLCNATSYSDLKGARRLVQTLSSDLAPFVVLRQLPQPSCVSSDNPDDYLGGAGFVSEGNARRGISA